MILCCNLPTFLPDYTPIHEQWNIHTASYSQSTQ